MLIRNLYQLAIITELIMIDSLAVDLEQYSYTANCFNCLSVLFQIRIIDQFIRWRSIQNNLKGGAKYYLLHDSLQPSSLSVEKGSFVNKTQPFLLLHYCRLTCFSCHSNIGLVLQSTSSQMPHSELLGRFFIDITKVRIKTEKQDVTDQLTMKFSQQWKYDADVSSIEFSEVKFKNKEFEETKPQKQQQKQQKQEEKHAKSSKSKNRSRVKQNRRRTSLFIVGQQKQVEGSKKKRQLNNIRRQLQLQNLQNKQIIHEIVSSIDFFVEVLESLEKRVSQVQTVCTVLKDKIEKIVPLLRKKNNQQ